MNWRGFLAIVLSMGVLFTWPLIAQRFFHYPIEQQNVTEKSINEQPREQFQQLPKELLQRTQPQTKEEVKKPLGNIAKFLLTVLIFLHNILRSWGLAIIALSILIWLVFSPLTAKSMKAMQKMQSLQPKIEELKKLYKDNPQKLNKEIMFLYREEKINPLGGCLPMLLQLPIFMGLYQMLMSSGTLNNANFLWIKDLSKQDQAFLINGFTINILPIIMAGLMFLQQKQSSKNISGIQAEQQKLMMIIFPLMFGILFYKMPAGLVLYWLVNTLLMVLTQWKTAKKIEV